MANHVLIIMPHPDDETFSSGGTLALHTRAGTPVTYVCGTRGEMGRNMGKPPFANRETLGDLREKELRDACGVLGVSDLRLMGLRDKTLEFMDPELLTTMVKTYIDEIQPSIVMTYHPIHGVHPDHNALGAAVIRAVAAMPKEQRPEVHTRAFGARVAELGEPDIVNDVSDIMEIKMAAIWAHRSQSESMFADQEEKAKSDPALAERMRQMRALEKFWIWRFAD